MAEHAAPVGDESHDLSFQDECALRSCRHLRNIAKMQLGVSLQGGIIVKKTAVLLATLALAGCASRASSVTAAYVSPLPYQNLTCEQLAAEAQAVSQRAQVATGAQNRRAMDDAAAMTVAMVVFWPALFMMRGDGAQAAELSRLKGEMDAIMGVSVQKQCGIVLEQPAA